MTANDIDTVLLRAVAQTYHGPRADVQAKVFAAIGPTFRSVLGSYGISSNLRVGHFLAQACVECQDFTTMEEEGSRSYFNQYNGRMGNLPPNDGWTFRGRGPFQLTGRDNYREFGPLVKCDLIAHPELAADPAIGLLISCEFWKKLKLNEVADRDDIVEVTHRINGGQNGIVERRAYLVRAKAALAQASASTMVSNVPVLHLGVNSPDVVALQRALVTKGFPITIDGDFGASTEAAVKLFQKSCNMAQDGIVGAMTWNALEAVK